MDRVTRAKLDSLVHQLQVHGERLGSIEEVARRLQLDPMIVRRVAEEQGVGLEDACSPVAGESAPADPNQSTLVMTLEEIHSET